MEQALSIVDIVQHILSFVPCQQDLYHACLVNSTWAAAGLVLLWRYPECHTVYTFQQLLETLRHEFHTRGPLLVSSALPAIAPSEGGPCPPRDAAGRLTGITTMPLPQLTLSPQHHYLLRQSTLAKPPQVGREYGIPFQGARHFYRGEFIRELDLRPMGNMLSPHHIEVIARSPKLGFRSLDFGLLHTRFSQDLHRIIAKSKNLRRLRVGPFKTSMDDLRLLRPNLAGLTELHLLHCTDRMFDPELSFILQATRQLVVLEIRGENFTDESLQGISACGSTLRQLTLETPFMTDKILGDIVSSCNGLEALRLEECEMLQDEAITTLIAIYERERRYEQATPTPAGLKHVFVHPPPTETAPKSTATPTLPSTLPLTADSSPASSRSSSFNSVASASSSAQSMLSSSPPDLKEANVLHSSPLKPLKFSESTWAAGGRRPLTSLAILDCDHLNPTLISLLIGQCPYLESVALGGVAITDDAFKSLMQQPFPHLQSLTIDYSPEVTDDVAMSVFFNCDTITDLTIRESNFTKNTFDAIAACLWQSLENLHLEQVKLVLNSSVEAILANCRRLRSLRLWNCRYLTIDLFVDETALPCPALEELEFMDKYARPTPSMHIQEQGDAPHGAGDNPQEPNMLGLERLGLGIDSRGGDSAKQAGCSQKFLECLVTRFENLRVLRLAKMTDAAVQPNIISYLTQLDRLEQFTIIRNPGITVDSIKGLAKYLPSLVEFGCSLNSVTQQNEASVHNMTCRKPRIRIFNTMFDTREHFLMSAD